MIRYTQSYRLFNFHDISRKSSSFSCNLINKRYVKSTVSNEIISIENDYEIDWKIEPILEILRNGGVGVIPTDTCYSFVTSIHSKDGISRLMDLKGESLILLFVISVIYPFIKVSMVKESHYRYYVKILKLFHHTHHH